MVTDSLIFGSNIGAIPFIQALFNLEFSKSCLFIFSLSNQVTSKIAKPFHFSFKQFSTINLTIVKAIKPFNEKLIFRSKSELSMYCYSSNFFSNFFHPL